MEITGTIKSISKTEVVGDKDFRKRNLILITEEKYPQTLSIEFTQDNVHLLDSFNTNDKINCAINIRGREWKNKQNELIYFTSLRGWKIEKQENAVASTNNDEDGLPF